MRLTITLASMLVVAVSGCSAPNSQLTTCQQEKEQLLTTIRTQRDTSRTLKEQVASLESRLDQAEKELARGGGNTRLSSRPKPAESEPLVPSSQSLPWRAPSGNSTPTAARTRGATNGGALLDLARRDRRLEYDAEARAARVKVPIQFEQETASLTAEDKRRLDDLARLLKSDEARELRVMVAGFAAGRPSTTAPKPDDQDRFASARQLGTARAQAVADYLDRHGIAQERLAVSGTGTRLPQDQSGGVQVMLMEADAPIAAFWPADQPLRR
jgi:outer membrane protein OmpA-like peptidoglycan-associated protein